MKNITVSVDDETHRLVRIRAAELDTSVSALLLEYLRGLANGGGVPASPGAQTAEDEKERRKRLMDEVCEDVRATRPRFAASENLPRSALHEGRSEVR